MKIPRCEFLCVLEICNARFATRAGCFSDVFLGHISGSWEVFHVEFNERSLKS